MREIIQIGRVFDATTTHERYKPTLAIHLSFESILLVFQKDCLTPKKIYSKSTLLTYPCSYNFYEQTES